jgi:hypothetical protein
MAEDRTGERPADVERASPGPRDRPTGEPTDGPAERAPTLLEAFPEDREVLLGPLVRDMQRALRSEFGALSFYSLLPRVTTNGELRKLLIELREDERGVIEEVRALIAELGGKPRTRRWTRSLAAWGLTLVAPLVGSRFATRLCYDAEAAVSRWYAQYAGLLARLGDLERAERCRDLSLKKHIHATRLATFVHNLPS